MSTATRSTKAKQTVEHILRSNPTPLSMRDLFAYVKIASPNTAYSTVFRIVQKLEQEEKITRVDWRERGSRFEWLTGKHHHHIVCQVCGKIADIADADVNFDHKKIQRVTGFIMQHHMIELEGICGGCQRKGTQGKIGIANPAR